MTSLDDAQVGESVVFYRRNMLPVLVPVVARSKAGRLTLEYGGQWFKPTWSIAWRRIGGSDYSSDYIEPSTAPELAKMKERIDEIDAIKLLRRRQQHAMHAIQNATPAQLAAVCAIIGEPPNE